MQNARRALILVPLVMSAALVATVLASYLTVRDVLVTLARGQGDALLDALRGLPGPVPTRFDLETFLAEHAADGLRCIALFDTTARPTLVLGDCSPEGDEQLRAALFATRAQETVDLGIRLRMARGVPSRPAVARAAAAGEAASSRPALLIEFEPLPTLELERGARRSLGIGGAASLALIVVAVGLWRLSLREERLEQEIARDRRLASLGEMAAVLAHEIRNPLTAMKGHAQLLAERLSPGSREEEKAARVVREAMRLEALTADLLGFVRSEQIERRDIDPAALLAAAAAEVGGDAGSGGGTKGGGEANGRIELDTAGAPARWSLDPRLVQRVLVNLLRNALQASPDGLPVAAAVREQDARLVITVRDRGAGIPEADGERIFEPFYTTRLHGTGLGLAVARRIVTLHGGTIRGASHPQGGAVFRVEIPRG